MENLNNNGNATDARDNDQSIFVLRILEKIKGTRLKLSQGSVTVFKKTASYQEVRVKLTNTQLNKLQSPAKNKTGTILRSNKNNVENEELPHKIFLTPGQTGKMRNTFANDV